MKQSVFEASEALQKWERMILKKTRSFCWFSSNSEVEVTWASLIGWPHTMSNVYILWHHFSNIICPDCTAKWIWDRSIFSIIEPSFDIVLFQDLWRFAQICTDMLAKLFLVLLLNKFRHITITKTILRANLCKSVQICANLCKSVQIFIHTGTMLCQMMA